MLGRVGGRLLGGKMKLDVNAARAAIKEKLADRLGMTVEEVAEGNPACCQRKYGPCYSCYDSREGN